MSDQNQGNMEMFDLTIPIAESLVTWPGDLGKFSRIFIHNIAADGVEVTQYQLGAHIGTHLDAPRHFIEGGSGVDTIPLSNLIGTVSVLTIPDDVDRIMPEHLSETNWERTERVIFKTRNTTQRLLKRETFTDQFVALTNDAAQFLVDKSIRFVGIDYLSVEAKGAAGHPVHKTLLGHGVAICEGLFLVGITAGEYSMHALPTRIVDGDAAPTRVILQRP